MRNGSCGKWQVFLPALCRILTTICLLAACTACGRGEPAAVAAGGSVPEGAAAPPETRPANEPQDPAIADHWRRLLPARPGFRWSVFGFAEYGHRTVLDGIVTTAAGIEYRISGTVEDASGGEAGFPAEAFRIEVRWILTPQGLLQQKKSRLMMETPCERLELLRAPLEAGTAWLQQQTDEKGRRLAIRSEILAVEQREGRRVFLVRYGDEAHDYYEEREIEEGWGVVSLQRRLRNEDGEAFMIGWSVYHEGSGYGQ